MKKHFILTLLAAVVMAIGIASCDPELGPAAVSQMPKPGLTLKVQEFTLNAYGARTTDIPDTSYITVSPVTGPAYGVTTVARSVIRPDTGMIARGDTIFTSFLENGDMIALQPFESSVYFKREPRWVTLPFGLKGTKRFVVLDTAFRIDTTNYRYHETWTMSFEGSEKLDTTNVLTEGILGNLSTMKARIVQVVDSLRGFRDSGGNLIVGPVETIHNVWFSPKLGVIVRFETVRAIASGTNRFGAGHGFTTIGWWQR